MPIEELFEPQAYPVWGIDYDTPVCARETPRKYGRVEFLFSGGVFSSASKKATILYTI